MQITSRRIKVFVEHFLMPPLPSVVEALRTIMEGTLKSYDIDIRAENKKPNGTTLEVDEFFKRTMVRAERMLKRDRSAAYAVCVAPILVEFRYDAQQEEYNVIAIALRNAAGQEWLYSYFLGTGGVPSGLLDQLAKIISGVLQERGALDNELDPVDIRSALALANLVTRGIDVALDCHVGVRHGLH